MARKNNYGKTLGKTAAAMTAFGFAAYATNQQTKALAEAYTVTPEPIYHFKGDTWLFPEVQGNLRYTKKWDSECIDDEIDAIAETVDNYGVACDLVEIRQGVAISRILVKLKGRTKISALKGIESELAVACKSDGLSVNVDNGEIFIDVPRKRRGSVFLGDLIKSDEFQKADKTALCIGIDYERNPIIYDLKDAKHVLIAGQTGSGKSVFMHNLILSLLMKNSPADIHLSMIDPKRVEFNFYSTLPHVSLVSDSVKAVRLLEGLGVEMDRRYNVISNAHARDIDEYNSLHPDNPMKREVVVIDELSDLMYACGKAAENAIVRLAQKARAAGIHLIIATQYPIAKVVTGQIKQNMPTKICLRVSTRTASMVALDIIGGEKLLGKGDLLFQADGALKPMRLQSGYVEGYEIYNIIAALHKNVISVEQPAPYIPDRCKSSILGILSIIACVISPIMFMWWFCAPSLIGLTLAIVGLCHPLQRKPACAVGCALNSLVVIGFLAMFFI